MPSDAELMQRAQRGDVDAFAQLYDRHAPIVLALAQRMLKVSGDAQDLLHDVFVEAWQRVREYDGARASVRTWLLVRLRSRALDRLERRARERTAQGALAHTLPPSAAGRGPHGVTERELAVREGLASLHESVRGTLELTYFEGLTAPEIAERMGVPEGTVRSRLARGLTLLAQLFSDAQPHDPAGQHAK